MSCIFKGFVKGRNTYIDEVGNKILSFNYSKNINNKLVLTVEEHELIDFTIVININDIFPNRDSYNSRIYHLPSTKNLLIHFDEEEVFYYNYYNRTAVKLLNTGKYIVPLSSFTFCYNDKEDIYIYNILNNSTKFLLNCQNINIISKLNNFLFIISENNNVTIYDLNNKCVALTESLVGTFYSHRTYFDKLVYIDASGQDCIYTVQTGKIAKLWSESSEYSEKVFDIFNDENNVYVFTRDKLMVCVNRNLDLVVQPVMWNILKRLI
jgi:hypothetical protein